MNPPDEAVARRMHDAAQRGRVAANDRAYLELAVGFARAGLRPLFLKGPVTRAAMGEAGAVRPSTDVDVLVAPAERRAAERLLRSWGYARRRGVHADCWTRRGSADIDLHWTIARSGVHPRSVWAILDEHRASVRVAGGTIPGFDDAATIVHLALHLTQNDSDRPVDDLAAALDHLGDDPLDDAVAIASALRVSTSVAWAFVRIGRDEVASRFGPAHLDPNTPFEAGTLAFLASPVFWREKVERAARNAENWLRFQTRRLVRFVTGRSATNRRIGAWLRRAR